MSLMKFKIVRSSKENAWRYAIGEIIDLDPARTHILGERIYFFVPITAYNSQLMKKYYSDKSMDMLRYYKQNDVHILVDFVESIADNNEELVIFLPMTDQFGGD
jgi:hypothetical protein